MNEEDAKIFANAMVKAAEASGAKIAEGVVESSTRIAKGMVENSKEIAQGMVNSSVKIAEGIKDGFGETAMELNKSLSGTKAELILKLLTRPNGTEIPEPESDKWIAYEKIVDKLLKKYE